MMFLKNKKAQAIGRLLLMIATIIVAAIAVSVIFNLNYSLDNKAVRVADRAETYSAIAMNVVQIYAEDGQDETNVKDFYIKIKLSAKSQEIRLSGLLLGFELHNETVEYTLNDVNYSNDEVNNCSWNDNQNSSGYMLDATEGNTTGTFGLEYLLKGPNFHEGYFQSGDFIKLCFRSPRGIETDEDITIHFIPKLSNSFHMNLQAPNIFNSKKIYLYPSRTRG